jgi:hypothetical protein
VLGLDLVGAYGKKGRGQKYMECKGKFVPLPPMKAYEQWTHSPVRLIYVEAPDTYWIGG